MQLSLYAQEPVDKEEWRSYGQGVILQKPTSLGAVLSNKSAHLKKEVMIEGTISEVCENKGCWMVVEDGGKNVRVEFKDYGFFVPWDSKGKKVRLQGSLQSKTISVAAAEYMASEMKDPPIAKGKTRKEQKITVFVATGVAIEGGSEISDEQKAIIEGKVKKDGEEHHH